MNETGTFSARRTALTGNKAAAHALHLARIQVLCFFPIGPSDEVGEELAKMIGRGEHDARIIDLANERSVMNAQVVATQGGVRCSFATNSEGLLYAVQQLIFASYDRIPMVITVAHRALEPPAIVRSDDMDTLMYRDIHWMHYHCENSQDVFDTLLQAYRVSEDHDVLLPAFVTYDGWEVSHNAYPTEIPTQEQVDEFLPPWRLPEGIDFLKINFGDFYTTSDRRSGYGYVEVDRQYMERRYQLDQALYVTSKAKILKAHEDYKRIVGRGYGGLMEPYQTEDAEVILLTMGSFSATARLAVDMLREAGKPVGMMKLRVFRPFPGPELVEAFRGKKVVVTLDRNIIWALWGELRSAFFGEAEPPAIIGRIAGVGGRDVTHYDIAQMLEEGLSAAGGKKVETQRWHFHVNKTRNTVPLPQI